MPDRERGYFWIEWSGLADDELRGRRPGPLIGEWDGRVWWFHRMSAYRFDSEVRVLGPALSPPDVLSPMARTCVAIPLL